MVYKIVFISQLMGREYIASLLRLYLIEKHVDILFLLGNILSPKIVSELARIQGLYLLGLPGNYDDVSITILLRRINGFVEARKHSVGVISFYGIGCNVRQAVINIMRETINNVDVLASFYPGYKYVCGENKGLEIIDEIIERLKPRLIVYGKCSNPCILDNIICLPPGYKGYVVFISLDKDSFEASIINLYNEYLDTKLR